jgi:hypothetical protein
LIDAMHSAASLPHFGFVGEAPIFDARTLTGWIEQIAVPAKPAAPIKDSSIAEPPQWLEAAQKNFAAISRLPAGWDGPRSKRISLAAIYRMDRILRDALDGQRDALPPYIVPAADGSLQMEWHTASFEFEFLLEEGTTPSAWLRNRKTGAELEGEGDKAIDLLFRWAKQIASPDHGGNVPSSEEAGRVLLAA